VNNALIGAPAVCKKWVQAYAAKRAGDKARTLKLVRELMSGFVGCADMPPLDFLPELLELYPDAKVVLTTRDPDKWLESIKPVASNATLWWLPHAMWPIPGWRWFPTLSLEFGTSTREYLADGSTDANPPPQTSELLRTRVKLPKRPLNRIPELLLNWNEIVKALVPPEKLLVMNVKEGWTPLCKFLDRPVPNRPFPRANDTNAANDAAVEIAGKVIRIWVGILSVSTVTAFGAWRLWKHR
jgi:hypothetical protein